MAFDQTKAYEAENGFIVVDGAGVFSSSGSPVGSDAPVGSRYRDVTAGHQWLKISSGVNGWYRVPINLDASSQVPAYLANSDLDTMTFYKSGAQTTANRLAKVTMGYDVDLNPTTETWQIFSEADGTTVLKTITFTHTFVSSDLTNTAVAVT